MSVSHWESPDVSTDRLGRHTLHQPRNGYRFSIDSVLLADFAPEAAGPVADLGAGCGVLCVLLAGRGFKGPFHAVEIDHLAADCCCRNFQAARLDGQVINQDMAKPLAELEPGAFGLVITNPPFYKKGQGRLPPEPGRAQARHQLSMDSGVVWDLAVRLLPKGGRLALCWLPSRLVELMAGLRARRLEPKRLRMVHGREGRPATLALVEAVKQGGEELLVEPPLFVYGKGQDYSDETQAIYRRLLRP